MPANEFMAALRTGGMRKSQTRLKPGITIQNTVATADLGQEVDIASFNDYEFLSSNLELYRCGYVKDDTMTGRVTVFRTGKMISVGTKSPEESSRELARALGILHGYRLARRVRIKPRVRNIVARFDLQKRLPIERLARVLPKCMYEPEQFPGLIYRLQDSCVALIFASGKGVIAGARSVEEVNVAYFDVESRVGGGPSSAPGGA